MSNLNNISPKCVRCGSIIKSNLSQEGGSDYYCANCIDKLNMQCPKCGSVAKFLQDEQSSPYFGYYCSKCKGTWFDLDGLLEFRPDGSKFFIRYRDKSK